MGMHDPPMSIPIGISHTQCSDIPYRLILWNKTLAGRKLWRITTIHQVFFADIPDKACGNAVCVVNVRAREARHLKVV